MITKEQYILLVETSDVSEELKKMTISTINTAYDIGFADGLTKGVDLQKQVFEALKNRR